MVSLLVQPNSESFWAFLRMVLTPLIQLCKINYVFNWTIHRKNQFMYVSFVTFDKLSQFQDACFGNNLGGTFARSILIRSGRSVKKWQQILYSRTTCFGVSSNTTTCDVIRLETCCYASKSSDNIRTLKCNRGLKPNGGNGKECIILPFREHLLQEIFFLLGIAQITSPPLPPIRATCTTFFGRQKRRFSAYYRTK